MHEGQENTDASGISICINPGQMLIILRFSDNVQLICYTDSQ